MALTSTETTAGEATTIWGGLLTRYVNLILDTFARTAGVNAGARAVSGNATPIRIGVNVSP